jgi:hypothetical protein
MMVWHDFSMGRAGLKLGKFPESAMAIRPESLPSRFPVGTKFVLEGRRDRKGRLRISSRYLEFPDGRQVDLLAAERAPPSRTRETRRGRVRRAPKSR